MKLATWDERVVVTQPKSAVIQMVAPVTNTVRFLLFHSHPDFCPGGLVAQQAAGLILRQPDQALREPVLGASWLRMRELPHHRFAHTGHWRAGMALLGGILMGKLRHIAITVPDPQAAADFYCKAFGMTQVGKSDHALASGVYITDGVVNLAFLHYKTEEAAGPRGTDFVGLHHIGFWVEDCPPVARAGGGGWRPLVDGGSAR